MPINRRTIPTRHHFGAGQRAPLIAQTIWVVYEDAAYGRMVSELVQLAGYPQVHPLLPTGLFWPLLFALPDLIIVDIDPSHPTVGWHTFHLLRHQRGCATIPILISVHPALLDRHARTAVVRGHGTVLAKPFQPMHLVAVVEQLIGPPV